LDLANGSLWSMGSNWYNELGLGNSTPSITPNLVSMPGVVHASAGVWHSAAVTTNGEVYVWGYNKVLLYFPIATHFIPLLTIGCVELPSRI